MAILHSEALPSEPTRTRGLSLEEGQQQGAQEVLRRLAPD